MTVSNHTAVREETIADLLLPDQSLAQTVADRTYSTTFSGLKSTAITAGAFIAGGVLLKEILQRMRRYPDEDRARKKEGRKDLPDRGVESWAMGYVYRARSYVLGPKTPDYSPTPLLWIWEAFLRKESYFETHAGADATVYIRFLRGTFFWMTFLLIIVFPILTGINYVYAASNFGFNSIDRASLTALVQGTRGLNLLPIHVTMVWLVTVSWLLTLFWIGRGVLRVRRNELRRLLRDDAERARLSPDSPVREDFSPELDPSIPPADLGWRYRTVLVRNIPVELRSEAALKQYFQERFSTATASEPPSEAATTYPPTPTDSKLPPRSSESSSVSETQTEMGAEGPLVAEIVLVRRQTELNELWFVKYAAVLHDLETAHVLLARNVMDWVRERVEREESARTGVVKQSPWEWFKTKGQRVVGRREQHDVEKDARAGDAVLFETLRPFLALPSTEDPLPETIWDALARLRQADPAILDRFQPQQRLRHFRSATVPAIDYHLTKHNLLFSLIEDQRARADEIEPASTAFVTFSRASDARRARADLGWTRLRRLRRGKVFELRAKMAPENRDLHWQRIVLVSLSSDILRQTLLNGIIWALTIIWVIPISLLIGLLSLQSLQERLPSLARWLETHEVARSLFTGLLPTAIISLLNMYTPTCIGIAKRKGLTLITESKWSAETQVRDLAAPSPPSLRRLTRLISHTVRLLEIHGREPPRHLLRRHHRLFRHPERVQLARLDPTSRRGRVPERRDILRLLRLAPSRRPVRYRAVLARNQLDQPRFDPEIHRASEARERRRAALLRLPVLGAQSPLHDQHRSRLRHLVSLSLFIIVMPRTLTRTRCIKQEPGRHRIRIPLLWHLPHRLQTAVRACLLPPQLRVRRPSSLPPDLPILARHRRPLAGRLCRLLLDAQTLWLRWRVHTSCESLAESA